MCRDVQEATGSKLVWPPSDPQELCSQGPWAQPMCSEGEWKQNPVNKSKRENTWGPEETWCMECPGRAPDGLWGFKHRGQPAVAIPRVLHQTQPLAPSDTHSKAWAVWGEACTDPSPSLSTVKDLPGGPQNTACCLHHVTKTGQNTHHTLQNTASDP